jgi:hypothetical protein
MNSKEKAQVEELVEDTLDYAQAIIDNLTKLEPFFVSMFGKKTTAVATLRSLLRQSKELFDRIPKVFSVMSSIEETNQSMPSAPLPLDPALKAKYTEQPKMQELQRAPNPFTEANVRKR